MYVICPNGDCGFSKGFERNEPLDKFCPLCGKPLIDECPNCAAYLSTRGATFCSKCGELLKKSPQA